MTLSEHAIWKEPWLIPLKKDILYEVDQFYRRKMRYLNYLGIEKEDLLQGVFIRLTTLKNRAEAGEYDHQQSSMKTWMLKQVSYAMEDLLREYSWSQNVLVRQQQHRMKHGQELIDFHIDKMDPATIQVKYIPRVIEHIQAKQLMTIVTNCLNQQSKKNRTIFLLYHTTAATMITISNSYQISESRVSQIIAHVRQAIKKCIIHLLQLNEKEFKDLVYV